MINHYEESNLEEKELGWTYGSRGVEAMIREQRHDGRSRKLRAPILNYKHKAERTTGKGWRLLYSQSLPPVVDFLHKATSSPMQRVPPSEAPWRLWRTFSVKHRTRVGLLYGTEAAIKMHPRFWALRTSVGTTVLPFFLVVFIFSTAENLHASSYH